MVAEENSEMTRAAKLAAVFRDIYQEVVSTQAEDGSQLAAQLITMPSRKKYPKYYEVITDPIDLATIEKNILTGQYRALETFDTDFLKLFKNVEVSVAAF